MEKFRRLTESNSEVESLRIERTNLSQEEFAKRCGIPRRTYVRWITGETTAKLSLKQLRAVCHELGIEKIKDIPDFYPKKHICQKRS